MLNGKIVYPEKTLKNIPFLAPHTCVGQWGTPPPASQVHFHYNHYPELVNRGTSNLWCRCLKLLADTFAQWTFRLFLMIWLTNFLQPVVLILSKSWTPQWKWVLLWLLCCIMPVCFCVCKEARKMGAVQECSLVGFKLVLTVETVNNLRHA